LDLLYTEKYSLSDYDANIIIDSKPTAHYFDELCTHSSNYKAAANWLNGNIKSYLNEHALSIEKFPISAKQIAALIELVDQGKVSNTVASQKVFPKMITNSALSPLEIAQADNLMQESNQDDLSSYIEQVFENNPEEVARYKAGEKQLTGFLMGQLMKISGGKADPKKANFLLREMLG